MSDNDKMIAADRAGQNVTRVFTTWEKARRYRDNQPRGAGVTLREVIVDDVPEESDSE